MAFSFINSANSFTLPPTCSANATAASFPDLSISPYNKSLTLALSPLFSPNLEPPVPPAFALTVTVSFKSAFSNMTIVVIIFVVDAMADLTSSFFPIIILFEILS